MKSKLPFSRYNLLWVMIICYLLPLLALVAYGALVVESDSLWEVFSLGLLLTCTGALAVFLALTSWENRLRPQGTFQTFSPEQMHSFSPEDDDLLRRSLEEAQQTQVRLLSEIDLLTEENRTVRTERDKAAAERQNEDTALEEYRKTLHHELEQQQNLIRELYDTIADQKNQLEKKQQHMGQLESKVGDLTYEIKTLLQFAETHAGSLLGSEEKPTPEEPRRRYAPVQEPKYESLDSVLADTKIRVPQEASQLLKRCLDTAQRITGSQRFGSQIYSFLDSPADSFALDLRRLCDRLRAESSAIVVLYSPRDNHLLFANNEVRGMTGWSPEKFTQNFTDILVDDSSWRQGLSSLSMRSEAHVPLQLKARSGEMLHVQVCLGMIPTGIFRNHTLAVFYTASPAGALEHELKH